MQVSGTINIYGRSQVKIKVTKIMTQLIAWEVTTSHVISCIKGKVLGMVTDLRSRSYFIGCLLGLNSTV
jgi:hypothetical protein